MVSWLSSSSKDFTLTWDVWFQETTTWPLCLVMLCPDWTPCHVPATFCCILVYCIYHLGLMHVKDICITIHICEAPTKRSSFAYRENHKPRKLTWGHCQPLLNGWESQVQETLKKNRKQILHQFHPTNDLKSYTYTSRAKWVKPLYTWVIIRNICKSPKKVYLNYPTISCK